MRPNINLSKSAKVIAAAGAAAALFAIPSPSAFAQNTQEPQSAPTTLTPRPESPSNPNAQLSVPYDASTSEAEARKKRWRLGPQLGMFFPTDERTRSRFGGNWTNLGLGIGGVPEAPSEGRAAFELYVMYNNRGDNQALVIPVGMSYRRALGNADGDPNVNRTFVYIGGSLSAYAVDVRSKVDNVRGGFRGTVGASPLIGMTMGRTGYIEARYHFIPEVSTFQMSGFNATFGLRF